MRNIIEYKNLIWADIIEPDEEDINYLKNFRLHPLTLKTIIPSVYHPDIDFFKDYLFLTIHYPLTEENGDIRTEELDIILGKNFFITNHYQKILPLNFIFEQCFRQEEKREEYLAKGPAFLLFSVLNSVLKDKLVKADQVAREIDSLEKELFSGREQEIIRKISRLKRKIVDFWRIIEPQRAIFESLKNAETKPLGKEFRPYFSNLLRLHRRIESVLRTSKETVESLEETNHILATIKLNEIIKILTLFSVVLLPLTLVASIWGMNTNFLPFSQSPFDFWLIMGLMALVLGGMLAYFKIKKWL